MDPELLRALRAWNQEVRSSSFKEEMLEAFRQSQITNVDELDIFERAMRQTEWTQCPPIPPLSEGMERTTAESLVAGDIIHDTDGLLNAVQRIGPAPDGVRMLMTDETWRTFRRHAVVTRVKAKEPPSETVRPTRFARIFADK